MARAPTPTRPPANRPLPLVDHLGREIDFEVLRQEVAGPAPSGFRSIYTGRPSRDLTPERLASILLAAETGDPIAYLELAEQMEEKDLHYLGVLGTRKREVSHLEITVEPASDDANDVANADLIREWIKRDSLHDELFHVLDAVGKGFSQTEILWETSSKEWMPRELVWRDPRFFRFDLIDGRTPLLLTDDALPQPLPPFKFISHVHPAKSGLPIRSGLARPVSWAWMFKTFTVKDWVAFCEVYGMPLRLGKYGPGATDAERRVLLGAVRNLGADAAAIIPESMTVEFAKVEGGSGGDLFQHLHDAMNHEVSKAVLGQTGTTDVIAGGHAVGRTHQLTRDDIKLADARTLARSLNVFIVRPIIDLNRGPQARYPTITIGLPEWVDIQALAGSLQQLVPLGLKVAMSDVRSRLGFADPTPDQDLLTPPAAPAALPGQKPPLGGPPTPRDPEASAASVLPARPGSHGFSGLLTAPAGGDALDRLGDAAFDDWEPLMEPLIAPVRDLVDGASSLAEVRDRLASALSAMDEASVGEMLARAGFSARIAGMVGADIGEVPDRRVAP